MNPIDKKKFEFRENKNQVRLCMRSHVILVYVISASFNFYYKTHIQCKYSLCNIKIYTFYLRFIILKKFKF